MLEDAPDVGRQLNCGSFKFLVTGATGSIGRKVTAILLERGVQVRGQFSRKAGADTRVDWRQSDFLTVGDHDRLLDGCDGAIHLAGELTNPLTMQRINVEATEALVNSAAKMGVRYFGHASSMVVYGSPKSAKIDETSPVVDPTRPMRRQFNEPPTTLEYARTKALSEAAVQGAPSAMAVDICRISKSAGTERFVEALAWGDLRVLMSSYGRTHYICEEDCAEAIIHLAIRGVQKATPAIEIYNICDATCGTYDDILRLAERKFHRKRRAFGARIPAILEIMKDLAKYRNLDIRYPLGMVEMSNSKLLESGFEFPIGYARGVEEALKSYFEAG
jgi:nucleoside-diphosphate-sugar epimerase